MDEIIEIPFGAFDSELKGWQYTIPEGMEAKIENGRIIVREKKNIDNILLDALLLHFQHKSKPTWNGFPVKDIIALIGRLKNRVPPQETEKLYIRTIKSLIADFIRGKEEIDTVYYQKIYDWLDGRHVEEQKQTKWSKNAITRGCAAIDISALTEADYIRREGKLLSISDLEKLPGFNED